MAACGPACCLRSALSLLLGDLGEQLLCSPGSLCTCFVSSVYLIMPAWTPAPPPVYFVVKLYCCGWEILVRQLNSLCTSFRCVGYMSRVLETSMRHLLVLSWHLCPALTHGRPSRIKHTVPSCDQSGPWPSTASPDAHRRRQRTSPRAELATPAPASHASRHFPSGLARSPQHGQHLLHELHPAGGQSMLSVQCHMIPVCTDCSPMLCSSILLLAASPAHIAQTHGKPSAAHLRHVRPCPQLHWCVVQPARLSLMPSLLPRCSSMPHCSGHSSSVAGTCPRCAPPTGQRPRALVSAAAW